MAEYKAKTSADLANCDKPFNDSDNYRKVIRFGNDELVRELNRYIETINDTINKRTEIARIQGLYNSAKNIIESEKDRPVNDYEYAITLLNSILGFMDSEKLLEKAKEKVYKQAVAKMNSASTEADFKDAYSVFSSLSEFMDADVLSEECLKKGEALRQEAEAVASILLADPDKTAMVTEDAIREELQKKAAMEALLDNFVNIRSSISGKKDDLYNTEYRINALIAERSKLGLFSGKEKRRIEQELADFEEKRKTIIADIDELEVQLNGYDNESQVKADLYNVNESLQRLEKRLQEERKSGISYAQAMTFYKKNNDAVRSICPVIDFAFANPGDIVLFGTYIQWDEKEYPIEWQVLTKNGGTSLVISRYALDCQRYNATKESVTWETCTLRKWLNKEFYHSAFSPAEQTVIATTTVKADWNPQKSIDPGNDTSDKVFLLSIKEANQYFSSDIERRCRATPHCYSQGAIIVDSNCSWWLRSPGHTSDRAATVFRGGTVIDGGMIDYCGPDVNSGEIAVRPALWISFE